MLFIYCSKEFLPLSEAKKMRRKKKDRDDELRQRALDNQGQGDHNNKKNIESRYSFNKPMLPPVSLLKSCYSFNKPVLPPVSLLKSCSSFN